MAQLLTKCKLFKKPQFIASYSKYVDEKEYKRCFKILEIEETSDQEKIRVAYLQLVKRYHPDSGSADANADKFHEIDRAFKTITHQKSKERWGVDDEATIVQVQDIKHTAPQHRQYLSFEGVGDGNPFQREKQYAQIRATRAAENVYNHRIAKLTAEENALIDQSSAKHNIKTQYGFDRLVEDLIQESMSRGEFNNLKNTGKPLPNHQTGGNPYVDFVTQKLNEVLIDNGFAPEWILLQKEIRDETASFRKKLITERQYFGPYPLSVEENIDWTETVYKYKQDINNINKKIAKFNLVVPILNKQILQICLEKEAQRAMIKGNGYEDMREERLKSAKKKFSESTSNRGTILGFIEHIFKSK